MKTKKFDENIVEQDELQQDTYKTLEEKEEGTEREKKERITIERKNVQ